MDWAVSAEGIAAKAKLEKCRLQTATHLENLRMPIAKAEYDVRMFALLQTHMFERLGRRKTLEDEHSINKKFMQTLHDPMKKMSCYTAPLHTTAKKLLAKHRTLERKQLVKFARLSCLTLLDQFLYTLPRECRDMVYDFVAIRGEIYCRQKRNYFGAKDDGTSTKHCFYAAFMGRVALHEFLAIWYQKQVFKISDVDMGSKAFDRDDWAGSFEPGQHIRRVIINLPSLDTPCEFLLKLRRGALVVFRFYCGYGHQSMLVEAKSISGLLDIAQRLADAGIYVAIDTNLMNVTGPDFSMKEWLRQVRLHYED